MSQKDIVEIIKVRGLLQISYLSSNSYINSYKLAIWKTKYSATIYINYIVILTLSKCCWYWNSVFAIWAKSFTRFEWSIMLTFERIPYSKSTCMIRFRRYVECKPNSKFFMVIRYQTCSWYSHVFFIPNIFSDMQKVARHHSI